MALGHREPDPGPPPLLRLNKCSSDHSKPKSHNDRQLIQPVHLSPLPRDPALIFSQTSLALFIYFYCILLSLSRPLNLSPFIGSLSLSPLSLATSLSLDLIFTREGLLLRCSGDHASRCGWSQSGVPREFVKILVKGQHWRHLKTGKCFCICRFIVINPLGRGEGGWMSGVFVQKKDVVIPSQAPGPISAFWSLLVHRGNSLSETMIG